MPYIRQEQRPPLDDAIHHLLDELDKLDMTEQDGALNYSITKLLHGVYDPSYFNYNRSLGLLTAVREEWYRRVVAPYEDTKIVQNGDVI